MAFQNDDIASLLRFLVPPPTGPFAFHLPPPPGPFAFHVPPPPLQPMAALSDDLTDSSSDGHSLSYADCSLRSFPKRNYSRSHPVFEV